MRWVTYCHGGEAIDRVGVLLGDEIYALPAGPALVDLLGDDGERLARAAERALAEPAEVVALGDARLRAPIPRPPSVRDFFAFEQHVRAARARRGQEVDADWYKLPVFYFSNPHATIGPGDEVPLPPGCRELDFELEVAAVVGLGGTNLAPDEAERHLAGYALLNDWSARDLQRREMLQQLGPAKGKDFATSLGPWLVTPDELEPLRKGNAFDLTLTATVNGREYSRASLAEIYWSFGEMLAYASRGSRVEPGDVLGSGTCGTGCILELSYTRSPEQFPWLQVGDEIALSGDRLGTLANRITAGAAPIPLR